MKGGKKRGESVGSCGRCRRIQYSCSEWRIVLHTGDGSFAYKLNKMFIWEGGEEVLNIPFN